MQPRLNGGLDPSHSSRAVQLAEQEARRALSPFGSANVVPQLVMPSYRRLSRTLKQATSLE